MIFIKKSVMKKGRIGILSFCVCLEMFYYILRKVTSLSNEKSIKVIILTLFLPDYLRVGLEPPPSRVHCRPFFLKCKVRGESRSKNQYVASKN